MRISDWSSDVCSSDLREADTNRTLYDGLLQRYKEVSAAAGITASNVSVVDEAAVPIDPSSPDLLLNLALALLAGVVIAGGAVFVREQLDDAIRAPEDIERKRSEEHTSELQSLMRISYAVFCLKKKNKKKCIIPKDT